MSLYLFEDDWRPNLRVEELAPSVVSAVRPMVDELRFRLVEWRLLADRTVDPEQREALYRNVFAWRAVLDGHQPNRAGRCPRCRTRWGRSPAWPCAQFTDLASALRDPDVEPPPVTAAKDL